MNVRSLIAALVLLACATAPLQAQDTPEAFGEQLAGALANNNAPFLRKHFDTDGFIALVVKGYESEKEFNKGFIQGFKQQAVLASLGQQLAGSTIDLLRVDDGKTAKPKVLIRLLMPSGALSYLHCHIHKKDGVYKLIDFYNYGAGDKASRLVRRLYLGSVLAMRQQAGRGSADLPDYILHMQKIHEAMKLSRTKQFKKAYQTLHQVPHKVKKEKLFLLTQLQITFEYDDKLYKEAIDAFLKHFPNDPAADLQAIDYHFLRNDFDASLKAIDRLDKRVGGDPYLHVMRAATYATAKKPKEAMDHYKLAVKKEPTLVVAYEGAMGLYCQDKQFEKAVGVLARLEKLTGPLHLAAIGEEFGMKEFAASKEYKAYRANTPLGQ
jgi:tetratricopeptide (TPR) repeat protein